MPIAVTHVDNGEYFFMLLSLLEIVSAVGTL